MEVFPTAGSPTTQNFIIIPSYISVEFDYEI